MPSDISKCPGTGCLKKEDCFRFTSKPSEHWQTWFVGVPFPVSGVCEFYWPTEVNVDGSRNDAPVPEEGQL